MQFADSDIPPYVLVTPPADPVPLLCDSPHSGSIYPQGFCIDLPFQVLQSAEDAWVDELWSGAVAAGATLLAANAPRTYIDVNRDLDDIDPACLAEPWPGTLNPTDKSLAGCGLIWTRIRNHPLIQHKLFVADIQNRIDRFYHPYHQVLEQQLAAMVEQFGVAWHLNVHSMPSDTGQVMGLGKGVTLADVVLSDRDGTTCDPTFIGITLDFLKARGYSVACNHPFKGMTLIRQFGQPARNRHSLQIEVNRALYMNEATGERSPGFDRLQHDLSGLALHLAQFARSLL